MPYVSATTSQTNVKKDKGVSKKGSAPTLKKNNAKEDGGLDAKEFCGKKNVQLTPTPTPEQVQKAKDFIWEYLEPHNRTLVVNMVTTDNLQKNGLVTEKVIIGFQYR